MIAYFDASALVKLVVEEKGSEQVASLWDGADLVVSSRVANAEVRAALAAAHRAGRLTDEGLRVAKQLWLGFWGTLRIVEVATDLSDQAGDLAEEHGLSGFDAIHLASALLLDGDELVFAVWDARLHRAAGRCSIATLPAEVS